MKYELITSVRIEDKTIRYGIRCALQNGEEIIIEDISSDKESIQRLVNNCNTYELSPIHIYDMIDDIIG